MKYRILVLTSLVALLSVSGVVLAANRPTPANPEIAQLAPAPQQEDVTPPDTTLDVGTPQYSELDLLWVSPSTSHTLVAEDNVDPPAALETNFRFYPVAGAPGAPVFGLYDVPFNLRGSDGRYRVEFFSRDTAGNAEEIEFRIEHLDSTPPLVTWAAGTPVFRDDFGRTWVTAETLHTLTANDREALDGSPGAGVQAIRYRVTGAPAAPSAQEFLVYETPFVLDGPDGEYEIDFFAMDNVDNTGQVQTEQVSLDTTPPAVDIGGPYVGDEGSEFTFDASATFDAGSGLAGIRWDLNGDGVFDDATGQAASRTFGDDGSFFLGIEAVDNLENQDIASTTVEVRNVDPVVTVTSISNPQPYPAETVTLQGSFTDAGWLDTHTAVIDWGDGLTTEAAVTEENEAPEATGTFTAQHRYSTTGPFNITVTVTDDDGGTGTASTQVEVGLSTQMPGTLIAENELMFYNLTGTIPNTWGSAEWQWRSSAGNADYWWIGQNQGWLFLFLKTHADAPSFDPQYPTEPWENYLTIAVQQEQFQRWFWCGIFIYDQWGRTVGVGCHPEWTPPPDGAGELHPWVAQRIEESESHILNIVQSTFQ